MSEGAGSRQRKMGYPQTSKSLVRKTGSVDDKYVDIADRVEATVEVLAHFIHPAELILSGTEARIKTA